MRWLVLALCACGASARGPAAPTVTVVEAGAEPRQVVRLAARAGMSERAELTVKLRKRSIVENTVLQESDHFTDLPSLRVAGTMTVADVAPGGDAAIKFSVDQAHVLDDVTDARVREVLVKSVRRPGDYSGSWRRSVTGVVDSAAEDADDPWDVATAMRGTGLYLPAEAIGVGARWTVTRAVESGRVRWVVSTTFHVRDLNDAAITLDATTEGRADEQAISTEPNASIYLKTGRVRGTAHIVAPLDGAVPTEESTSTVELDLLLTRGRDVRVQTQDTTERIFSMRPAIAAP